MSEIDKKICREVRAELARRGLTFTKVAEILGVTLSSVTNQMNGRHFGRKNAEKWAETFGFSATFLMTGEGTLVPGVEGEAPAAADDSAPAAEEDDFFIDDTPDEFDDDDEDDDEEEEFDDEEDEDEEDEEDEDEKE